MSKFFISVEKKVCLPPLFVAVLFHRAGRWSVAADYLGNFSCLFNRLVHCLLILGLDCFTDVPDVSYC